MKKLVSLIITASLIGTIATSAFAEEFEVNNVSENPHTITGEIISEDSKPMITGANISDFYESQYSEEELEGFVNDIKKSLENEKGITAVSLSSSNHCIIYSDDNLKSERCKELAKFLMINTE